MTKISPNTDVVKHSPEITVNARPPEITVGSAKTSTSIWHYFGRSRDNVTDPMSYIKPHSYDIPVSANENTPSSRKATLLIKWSEVFQFMT